MGPTVAGEVEGWLTLADAATPDVAGGILTSCEDEGREGERVEDIAHVHRLQVRTIMRDETDSCAFTGSACERVRSLRPTLVISPSRLYLRPEVGINVD